MAMIHSEAGEQNNYVKAVCATTTYSYLAILQLKPKPVDGAML